MMSTTPIETQLNNIQIRTNELKQLWYYWRDVLLLINNLLEWTNVFHSIIFFASLTLTFTVLYLLDPPVLIIISIFLLIFGLIYTSGPLCIDLFKSNNDWTLVNDEKYSQICERIAYFEEFIRKQCRSLKQPSITVEITIGVILLCLVFCGQWINILVLIYLTALILCLTPVYQINLFFFDV